MIKKASGYVSISLTEEVLKIAEIKGSGSSFKVVKVVARDVKGVEEGELSQIVQGALDGFDTKKNDIIVVVAPTMTSTKNIEIPSVNPEEIKSIVSLQAGRHTPFSREEIQIGYINLGVYKNNYTKVLLVIANRNILKGQLDILEAAGLKTKKILFAPEGIAGFYSHALNLKKDTTPTGIVDIGKTSTDFIVALRGLAITSRNIPVGKSHLSAEGASAQDKLVDELKKTIDSYQSEDIDEIPSQFLLTGNDEGTTALSEIFQQKLGWSNVSASSYVDNIKASQDVLQQLASEYGENSFLDVIAAAANAPTAQVNLMPEEVQLQKSIEDQSKAVFKTAILSLLILVLVATGLGLRMYFQNTYLKKLVNNYKSNRDEVAALTKQSLKTMIVHDFLNSRTVSLDVINELYENVPDEIYFTSLVMDEEGNVSIQGISDIPSSVYNLGTRLKESDKFRSSDVKSTTAKKDRGKDVSAFEISLKLTSATEDEMGEETEE